MTWADKMHDEIRECDRKETEINSYEKCDKMLILHNNVIIA